MAELVQKREVPDGVNVVIDGRFAAYFPHGNEAQVDHLIECVNNVYTEKIEQIERLSRD